MGRGGGYELFKWIRTEVHILQGKEVGAGEIVQGLDEVRWVPATCHHFALVPLRLARCVVLPAALGMRIEAENEQSRVHARAKTPDGALLLVPVPSLSVDSGRDTYGVRTDCLTQRLPRSALQNVPLCAIPGGGGGRREREQEAEAPHEGYGFPGGHIGQLPSLP